MKTDTKMKLVHPIHDLNGCMSHFPAEIKALVKEVRPRYARHGEYLRLHVPSLQRRVRQAMLLVTALYVWMFSDSTSSHRTMFAILCNCPSEPAWGQGRTSGKEEEGEQSMWEDE